MIGLDARYRQGRADQEIVGIEDRRQLLVHVEAGPLHAVEFLNSQLFAGIVNLQKIGIELVSPFCHQFRRERMEDALPIDVPGLECAVIPSDID